MGCCFTKSSIDKMSKLLKEATLDNIPHLIAKGTRGFAKVLKCIDGDTFHLAFELQGTNKLYQHKCRAFGYNTQEIKGENANDGKFIRDKVKGLIENKIVFFESYGPEKYGRILVQIWFINDLSDPTKYQNLQLPHPSWTCLNEYILDTFDDQYVIPMNKKGQNMGAFNSDSNHLP